MTHSSQTIDTLLKWDICQPNRAQQKASPGFQICLSRVSRMTQADEVDMWAETNFDKGRWDPSVAWRLHGHGKIHRESSLQDGNSQNKRRQYARTRKNIRKSMNILQQKKLLNYLTAKSKWNHGSWFKSSIFVHPKQNKPSLPWPPGGPVPPHLDISSFTKPLRVLQRCRLPRWFMEDPVSIILAAGGLFKSAAMADTYHEWSEWPRWCYI